MLSHLGILPMPQAIYFTLRIALILTIRDSKHPNVQYCLPGSSSVLQIQGTANFDEDHIVEKQVKQHTITFDIIYLLWLPSTEARVGPELLGMKERTEGWLKIGLVWSGQVRQVLVGFFKICLNFDKVIKIEF